MVDERDHPLAGAIVVVFNARPVGAPGMLAAGTARDRARPRSGPLLISFPAPAPAPEGEAEGDGDIFLDAGAVALSSTEADGRFALPTLPPGRYVLFALHVGPPSATSDVLMIDQGFLAAPLRLVISRSSAALL